MMVASVAAGAYAQGTIVFNNRISGPGGFYSPVYLAEANNAVLRGNSAAGTPVGGTAYTAGFVIGTGYTAELWGGPTGGSLALAVSNGVTVFRTSTTAGVVGSVVQPIAGDAVIGGVAAGGIADIQMRVYDNKGGTITSWAQAQARSLIDNTYQMGSSAVFQSGPLGGIPTVGLPISSPNMDNVRSFNLQAVPEPSVLAFGALGLVGLLARRRK